MTLNGRKIAILIAPRGTEEPEFKQPKDAVEAAGAMVAVIGIETGEAKTNNNDLDAGGSYQVDNVVSEVPLRNSTALSFPAVVSVRTSSGPTRTWLLSCNRSSSRANRWASSVTDLGCW